MLQEDTNSTLGSLHGQRTIEEKHLVEVKGVIAQQLVEAMVRKRISKIRMASLLKASRTQVDPLFDPGIDVTLSTLQRRLQLSDVRSTSALI